VLVGREGFGRRAGMARRSLGGDFGEFLLKASSSSAVAAFGTRDRPGNRARGFQPQVRTEPPPLKRWRSSATAPLITAPLMMYC
jgi:hypothetical protein